MLALAGAGVLDEQRLGHPARATTSAGCARIGATAFISGQGLPSSAEAQGDGVGEFGGKRHLAAAPDGDVARGGLRRGFHRGGALVEADQHQMACRRKQGLSRV